MKKIMIITLIGMIGGFLFTNQASAGVIEKRMHKQRLRIQQGILSGELTRSEAEFLKREQRHIREVVKIAWEDGKLKKRERRHIHKLQNRAGKQIHRLKHNDARRRWGFRHSRWIWNHR
jgi:hypothetical protein